MEKIERLQQIINRCDRLVFFGGAGVSTESGIPDFRSVDGLYHQKYEYPPETILSHSFFLCAAFGAASSTSIFFRFYREKMLVLDAAPNAAHKKLAELEQAGKLKAVVTQNIDGLHQAAGSRKVLELHGSIHRNYCMNCGAFYDAQYIRDTDGVPRCKHCKGIVKPDVVLYEEALDQKIMEESVNAISEADVLIVGGTSLAVYPAAGLLRYFQGEALIVLNRSATPVDGNADLLIEEPIGQVMARIKVR